MAGAPATSLSDANPAAEPAGVARTLLGVMPTLMRLLIEEMHRAPHTAGMNFAQFRVLCRLHERDYRAAELAAILDVGRPTLTVTAEHLVRRGLVERLRDLPHDRRGVVFRLTPAGRTLYRALEARAVGGLAELLTRVGPDERAALATGLTALRRSLEQDGRSVLPLVAEQSPGESA